MAIFSLLVNFNFSPHYTLLNDKIKHCILFYSRIGHVSFFFAKTTIEHKHAAAVYCLTFIPYFNYQ